MARVLFETIWYLAKISRQMTCLCHPSYQSPLLNAQQCHKFHLEWKDLSSWSESQVELEQHLWWSPKYFPGNGVELSNVSSFSEVEYLDSICPQPELLELELNSMHNFLRAGWHSVQYVPLLQNSLRTDWRSHMWYEVVQTLNQRWRSSKSISHFYFSPTVPSRPPL